MDHRQAPDAAPDQAEDRRAEYAAVAEYHGHVVNSRFTIAGLYVAANGFLVSAVLSKDATWVGRLAGALLAVWVTGCLWVLELRSRALFTNVAHRAIEIEHEQWGLTGQHLNRGLFGRQYKEPPGTSAEGPGGEHLHRRQDPDRPRLGWARRPLPTWVSRRISHSMGLDLLYAGVGVFWAAMLAASAYQLSAGNRRAAPLADAERAAAWTVFGDVGRATDRRLYWAERLHAVLRSGAPPAQAARVAAAYDSAAAAWEGSSLTNATLVCRYFGGDAAALLAGPIRERFAAVDRLATARPGDAPPDASWRPAVDSLSRSVLRFNLRVTGVITGRGPARRDDADACARAAPLLARPGGTRAGPP
jgi:hypothetical protein